MAVDMFLKLEGIDGESGDDSHGDEIDVLAWAWGVTQSGSMHGGGGGGAGKANVQDLSVTKFVDKASPVLMKYCCKGTHVPEATLVVRKAGDKPLEYVVMTLKKCLISSVSTGGSGGEDRLTENISLNFEEIKYDYVPQKEDGSGDAAVTMGWNAKKNVEAG